MRDVMPKTSFRLGTDADKIVYFLARASRQKLSECDEWEGGHRDGYGRVRFAGRKWQVARLLWTLARGPIPDGLVLDHALQNIFTDACSHGCICLHHLEITTPRVNTLRGHGLAAQNARKGWCLRGHPFDVENTKLGNGQRNCRACNRVRARARRARAKGLLERIRA